MSDTDDIPFDRAFLCAGRVEEVAPGVRRICATIRVLSPSRARSATSSAAGKVAIIDPGPDDERMSQALLDAVRGETVTHIFVTHTHRDHSPTPRAIKAATGAAVYAEGPHRAARPRFEARSQSRNPAPTAIQAGHRARPTATSSNGDGWALEAVRRPATPPTTWRLRWPGTQICCSRRSCHGLVDLDRGAAGRRDERLHGLARKARAAPGDDLLSGTWRGPRCAALRPLPHPSPQGREASILHRLAKGEADIPTMVRAIYIGLDPRLAGAAGRSVLAHLEDLVARGRGRDGRRAVDRRALSLGGGLTALLRRRFRLRALLLLLGFLCRLHRRRFFGWLRAIAA